MSDEERIKNALRSWLCTNGRCASSEVTDDTPLLEFGVITSLQLVELVRQIEKLRKKSLPFDSIQMGAFKSIDTIYRSFF